MTTFEVLSIAATVFTVIATVLLTIGMFLLKTIFNSLRDLWIALGIHKDDKLVHPSAESVNLAKDQLKDILSFFERSVESQLSRLERRVDTLSEKMDDIR